MNEGYQNRETPKPDPSPSDLLEEAAPPKLRYVGFIAFPLLLGLAYLIQASPLQFFLQGFHIWIHEFGHSMVAWFSGYNASPLPIGWTNVGLEKSNFVYFGVLFLLGLFAWAGWNEGKPAPIIIAVVLIPLQAWMTWKLPAYDYEVWMAYGGIGGEFVLSTAFTLAFFLDFPEKFRWGICKYLFLLLGATTFWQSYTQWMDISAGRENIPWGTLIHGGDDQGGDMNILTQYGWTPYQIVTSYEQLAKGCLATLVAGYTLAVSWFLLRKMSDQKKVSSASDRKKT